MEARYFTYTLNALAMLLLPLGLATWLTRRLRSDWGLVGIGAVTFILSQVGHIPFNMGVTALFQKGVLSPPPAQWQLLFNAVFLGLSAGVWEELARYIGLRWWAKATPNWQNGILYGAGHGGIEAFILGIFTLVALFQAAALKEADLTQLMQPGQIALAQQQLALFWSTPLHLTVLGALERIFAVILHLSLSLLVMQALRQRRMYWVLLSIGWHALANALALIVMARWGAVWAEGALFIVALASLGIIFGLRSQMSDTPQQVAHIAADAPPPLPSFKDEVKPEDLDQSRYSN